MAVAQRQVDYVQEVDALLQLVVQAIKDAKAGKNAIQIGSDLLPGLVAALGGITQLGTELGNKQAVETTVGYDLGLLVNALTA